MTYLVFPRPKCSSILNCLALDNLDHAVDRVFGRYLATVDFPRNVDLSHVAVSISYVRPEILRAMSRHSRCYFARMQGQNDGFTLFSFQLLGHVLC